jgi:hypothetical protein
VLLAVAALAAGREVIVSRGELVEIGGSFRMPEVMALSGARLREVGTTNRTHPDDYRRAVGAQTGLLVKAHTSNYRIVGFTASVDLAELVAIGRAAGVPVLEDLGSGAAIDLAVHGFPARLTVREQIATGATSSFSGDKLLGDPQAGLIVGRADRSPARSIRCAARCARTSSRWRPWPHPLRLYREAGSARCCRCCAGSLVRSATWVIGRDGGRAGRPPRSGHLVTVVRSEARSRIGALPATPLETARWRSRIGSLAGGRSPPACVPPGRPCWGAFTRALPARPARDLRSAVLLVDLATPAPCP